jgi:Rieske Fe-S protein
VRYTDSEIISIPPDGRPEEEQPRWRRDFPIDWPQDDYVARRDFTKFLVLTSFAFSVGQLWIVAKNFLRSRQGKPPIRQIAAAGTIPVGGTMQFSYPNAHDNCLLMRLGENEYVAYNQACTHLSCPVKPEQSTGTLHCPCHNGRFEMSTGRALSGPPRRPLTAITLDVRSDGIYAVGVEERTA